MGIAFVAVVLIMLVFPALMAKAALKKSTQGFGMSKYARFNEDDRNAGNTRKSKSTPKKKINRVRSTKTTRTARTKTARTKTAKTALHAKPSKKKGGSKPKK